MNRTIAWIAAACLCAALGVAACARDYGVTINAIPGLPQDFVKGADVSMLAQLEASGARFYDEDGRQKDALRILREHGVNWVRLRLWNAPVLAHDFSPEAGVTARAGEAAGGANDLARDIALARRARALGMKVLLDFHYSDWWADPGKQPKPAQVEQTQPSQETVQPLAKAGEVLKSVTVKNKEILNIKMIEEMNFNTVVLQTEGVRYSNTPYKTDFRTHKSLDSNVAELERSDIGYIIEVISGPSISSYAKVMSISDKNTEKFYFSKMIMEIVKRYEGKKS
jgi:arabinogalactan endo-1,4-beta-galactosidase